MATAFKYHPYECFGSQIQLSKLSIVKGEPDNSQNKNESLFWTPSLLKCNFFAYKYTKIKCLLLLKIYDSMFSLEGVLIF